MKKLIAIIPCFVLLAGTTALAKAPAKAAQCVACHGPKGVSSNDMWPNLAGQKKGYLAKQMKDFKSGKRKDPLMTSQAKLLSDADIKALADYFSKL